MGRIGIVIPVVLLTLTGCTSTTATGRATARETPVDTASSSTPSAGPSATPSVPAGPLFPPQLPDAQKTFIKTGGKTGSHSFPALAQIQRGTLEVAVICSGSGHIEVNVGSLVSYTVVCADGDPGQVDEVAMSHGHKNVAVSVTSKTSGSWGLSVGWTKTIDPPG